MSWFVPVVVILGLYSTASQVESEVLPLDPQTCAKETHRCGAPPANKGKPCNCVDLMKYGVGESGIYTVYVPTHINRYKPINVYCDMDTDGGGWLVFQRRQDGSEDFFRGWSDYKHGFGELDKEFWLGNANLYEILNTCGNRHHLRVDLEDFDGNTAHASYSIFTIFHENVGYRLFIMGYSGNAGDSMAYHNHRSFSTRDKDDDLKCATSHRGGWWYNNCLRANLNGPYKNGTHEVSGKGVNWNHWKGSHYSLKFTEMKFRPNL